MIVKCESTCVQLASQTQLPHNVGKVLTESTVCTCYAVLLESVAEHTCMLSAKLSQNTTVRHFASRIIYYTPKVCIAYFIDKHFSMAEQFSSEGRSL